MDNRLCSYVFVMGPKKGQTCGKLCRNTTRGLCYPHHVISQRYNNNLKSKLNENIDEKQKTDKKACTQLEISLSDEDEEQPEAEDDIDNQIDEFDYKKIKELLHIDMV